jgi:hypothetical protein
MDFRIPILANPVDNEGAHLDTRTHPYCATTERRKRNSVVMMCAWTGSQEEGGGDAVFDSNPFGFIYDEARSRCEQYGGHWKGHKCVGIPRHKDQGPEVVKNICIFDWWNPVGWVCGAAAAGKAAYEAANK